MMNVNALNNANNDAASEVTIYKRAVELCESNYGDSMLREPNLPIMGKRDSSSSKELVNISDENMQMETDRVNEIANISGKRMRYEDDTHQDIRERREPVAHSSRQEPLNTTREIVQPQMLSEADKLVQQAERAKARILEVPGKEFISSGMNYIR